MAKQEWRVFTWINGKLSAETVSARTPSKALKRFALGWPKKLKEAEEISIVRL